MTKFKGMLLFDIPEDAVNGWENQLGYRGMMEVWKKGGKTIYIEPFDDSPDSEEEWEAWWETDGDSDSIAFGTYEECDKAAKEYMRKN